MQQKRKLCNHWISSALAMVMSRASIEHFVFLFLRSSQRKSAAQCMLGPNKILVLLPEKKTYFPLREKKTSPQTHSFRTPFQMSCVPSEPTKTSQYTDPIGTELDPECLLKTVSQIRQKIQISCMRLWKHYSLTNKSKNVTTEIKICFGISFEGCRVQVKEAATALFTSSLRKLVKGGGAGEQNQST